LGRGKSQVAGTGLGHPKMVVLSTTLASKKSQCREGRGGAACYASPVQKKTIRGKGEKRLEGVLREGNGGLKKSTPSRGKAIQKRKATQEEKLGERGQRGEQSVSGGEMGGARGLGKEQTYLHKEDCTTTKKTAGRAQNSLTGGGKTLMAHKNETLRGGGGAYRPRRREVATNGTSTEKIGTPEGRERKRAPTGLGGGGEPKTAGKYSGCIAKGIKLLGRSNQAVKTRAPAPGPRRDTSGGKKNQASKSNGTRPGVGPGGKTNKDPGGKGEKRA